MKRRLTAAASLVLLAAAAGCTDQPAAPPATPGLTASASAGSANQAIPGRYIVVLKRGSDARGEAGAAAARGGTVHFVYEHALDGFAATLPAPAVDALRRNPRVAFIEPDQLVRLDATQPSPPSWGLDRVDQRSLPLNAAYNYYSRGRGVHAYIIDSGLRATHSEFTGRVGDGYTMISDGRGTGDCNGHGTHVAGTVGGTSYGVAKGVTIHPVRVFGCTDSSPTSTIIAGVDAVTANAVKPAVVNMSLGGGANAALDSAVRRSIATGLVYVIAAGNNIGRNACDYSPARVADAITVGASTMIDERAPYSNIGSCVDLFAPGTTITSAGISGDNASVVMNGTSMAAPHVAGAVALYLENASTATPSKVHSEILLNATSGKLTNVGSGSPNRLLFSLERLKVTMSGPVHITTGGVHTWSAIVTGGETPGVYTYTWDMRVMDPCGTYEQHGISSSSSYTQEVWPYDPDFYLYARVTSGSETVTGTRFVNATSSTPWC